MKPKGCTKTARWMHCFGFILGWCPMSWTKKPAYGCGMTCCMPASSNATYC